MTFFDVYRNLTHLLCSMLLHGFLFGLPARVFLSRVISMSGFYVINECQNMQKGNSDTDYDIGNNKGSFD